MTNWQLLFETDLTEGQEWVISSDTTALEFRIEQTLIPALGLFAIAQILDPVTEEYIDIKNVPAKAGNTRLVLNPLQYTTRQIGVKFQYAEWPGEPQLWHVAVYYNADVTESANPVSIVVDVLPRLVGAEPLGAAAQAKAEAIAAAQALIDAIPQPELNFDPAGSAATAQANAIAAAQGLINNLTAADVGADPAGSAATAQANAIAAAQTLINNLTAADVGADEEGASTEAANYAINTANARLPVQFFGFWFLGKVLSGGVITATKNTSWNFGIGWAQAPPALNDEVQFQVPLQNGNYRLILEGVRASDSGQQSLTVNGASLGTVDWYNSTTVYNAQLTKDFSVNSGLHTLKLKVSGKNAASTNYYARIALLIINQV